MFLFFFLDVFLQLGRELSLNHLTYYWCEFLNQLETVTVIANIQHAPCTKKNSTSITTKLKPEYSTKVQGSRMWMWSQLWIRTVILWAVFSHDDHYWCSTMIKSLSSTKIRVLKFMICMWNSYFRIRFRQGNVIFGRFNPKVKCDLKVPLSYNNTNTTFTQLVPTKCDVDIYWCLWWIVFLAQ